METTKLRSEILQIAKEEMEQMLVDAQESGELTTDMDFNEYMEDIFNWDELAETVKNIYRGEFSNDFRNYDEYIFDEILDDVINELS
jgi:hypothetical protein